MTDQIGHAQQVLGKASRRRWLERRRKGITATDVAAILGQSKWKTPLDVWMAKRDPVDPSDSPGYAAQRGLLLERLLLDTWAAETGATLLDVPKLVSHPTERWALASLDGAADDGNTTIVLEVKTAGWRARDDWWDELKLIPDDYAIQVLWQLYVTGLNTAVVIADIAGDRRTLTIDRDPDWELAVVPLVADWWKQHVQAGEPPDPDPIRDYPSLNRLWIPDPGVSMTADAQHLADVQAWHAATAEHKQYKRIADELRGRLRIAMQDATRLEASDGTVLAAIDKRGALSIKKGNQ